MVSFLKSLNLILLLGLISVSLSAEPISIGVSLADLGNPFFTELGEALNHEAQLQTHGQVRIDIQSSAYDLERQQNQLRQFIQDNVDLILLSAAHSELIAADIRLAQRAGIVVTAIDIDADGADVTVTSDNIQAGEISCQALVNRLGNQGRIAIINGAKVSSVSDRVAGCRSVLNNYPDIELIADQINGGGTFEGGLEAMTFLLSRYDDIAGVFAINDPSALGALKALKLFGNHQVLIASVDGSEKFVRAMNEGEKQLIATAAQKPADMANLAIKYSLQKIAEKDATPIVVRIPTSLVIP